VGEDVSGRIVRDQRSLPRRRFTVSAECFKLILSFSPNNGRDYKTVCVCRECVSVCKITPKVADGLGSRFPGWHAICFWGNRLNLSNPSIKGEGSASVTNFESSRVRTVWRRATKSDTMSHHHGDAVSTWVVPWPAAPPPGSSAHVGIARSVVGDAL